MRTGPHSVSLSQKRTKSLLTEGAAAIKAFCTKTHWSYMHDLYLPSTDSAIKYKNNDLYLDGYQILQRNVHEVVDVPSGRKSTYCR